MNSLVVLHAKIICFYFFYWNQWFVLEALN
uniref:Uncharacterized protein n=1 Tax=Arundo donax TaxID=35708 RepID=A0A0A9G124_ARUDO